jgi:putative zinc finger/helix-turn-helix YgiT family protein
LRCGETYTSIPAIEGLHRQIAAAVIRKKGRLAPAEIRFLRKWLGWSGVDFAKRTGTKPETVSRWENGRTLMGPQADRLLRVLVAKETPGAGDRDLSGWYVKEQMGHHSIKVPSIPR